MTDFMVSPTERSSSVTELGMYSSLPELYGADILFTTFTTKLLVGVQRKEISDLIASLQDGRLGKEVAQLQQCDVKLLIVEGKQRWSNEGILLNVYKNMKSFNKLQYRNALFSVRLRGVWVIESEDATDTAKICRQLDKFLDKDTHGSLLSRVSPKGDSWGRKGNRDWGIHVWTSFPGIGTTIAQDLYDKVGLPFKLTVTREELMEIKGMGKVRVDNLMKVLEGK